MRTKIITLLLSVTFSAIGLSSPADLFSLGSVNKKMRTIVFDQYFNDESYRLKFPSYLWSDKYAKSSQYISIRISNALNRYEELNEEQRTEAIRFVLESLGKVLNGKELDNAKKITALNTEYEKMYRDLKGFSEKNKLGKNKLINLLLQGLSWNQVRDQVWAQVDLSVFVQVRAQFRAQFGDQVWDQFKDQFGDQVWDQVRAQVGDQVNDQVWVQVRSQFGDQFEDQVNNRVWYQVQIWSQVAQVSDQVKKALETFNSPSDFTKEKIRDDLLPKLKPIIHYLFIVNQILVQVLNSAQLELNYKSLAKILEEYKIEETNFNWVQFFDWVEFRAEELKGDGDILSSRNFLIDKQLKYMQMSIDRCNHAVDPAS